MRTKLIEWLSMRLADYLTSHDLGFDDFAARIGTTAESVRRYARGTRIPRPAVMAKIVTATKGAVLATDFYPPTAEAG